ncbi:MAG: DUF4197 domain-containing protein [Bacteroidales bacterium]|nr:DUF4197 domain-containing protein [Candidatus Latescibacterota bacterium]
MKTTHRTGIIFSLTLMLVLSGCVTLQEDLAAVLSGDPGREGPLDEGTVIAGIKEALKVGTNNSVLSTSRIDGFLGNQLIRIALPEQLQSMATTLRGIGLGGKVDELEVGMNRAAELAAGEAREVLWSAITGMSVADAFGILRGHDTAATDYFHEKTHETLQARFRPIVHAKIQEIGLSRLYGQAADAYNSLSFTEGPRLVDLDDYVTERAMSGLFTVLAGEEQKIRKDPLARTTDLLKRVFGN